jgi:DNA replication protein DnaC
VTTTDHGLPDYIADMLIANGITPTPVDGPAETADEPDPRTEWALARWEQATPPRYRRSEATHPDVAAWAQQAAEWDPRQLPTTRSLLITGPTGTGKTYQAFGALRLIAENHGDGFECIAITSADLYGSLRPTGGMGDTEARMRKLCEVRFLLVDDLGTAKTSEFTEEVTYRLINYRYNHCLPTIFTSNLPPQFDNGPDLVKNLGERSASRLAEMVTTVVINGTDRRRGQR